MKMGASETNGTAAMIGEAGSVTEFNPMAPALKPDPYPYYKALRETPGLVPAPVLNAHVVARYDEVKSVLRNHQQFSSDPLIKIAFGEFNPAPSAPYMLASDPPEHTRLRRLVGTAFSPKLVASIADFIQQLVDDLLDEVDAKNGFDLLEEFSVPLPVSVIAKLLGVDPSMAPTFRRWSNNVTVGVDDSISPQQRAAIEQDAIDFREYFIDRINYARKHPADDLISMLVRAEEEGQHLSADEVMAMCVLLLIAGNETTTSTIANAIYLLTKFPDQKTKVLADDKCLPTLVEETLRYISPIQMLFRRATEDVELAGMHLPKDSIVMPIYASANRDESIFANADQFDVTRKDVANHMAFGNGIHFCIGQALGRHETQVALRTLLKRFPDITADVSNVEWADSFYLRGPKVLQVRA